MLAVSRVLLEEGRSVYARSLVLSLGERQPGRREHALEGMRVGEVTGELAGPSEGAIRAREDVLVLSMFGGALRTADYAAGKVPFTEALLTVRDCRALQMLLASALPGGATYFHRPLPGDFGGGALRRGGARGDREATAMAREVRGRRR